MEQRVEESKHTGGYLLTACFSTGQVAGTGAEAWLKRK